jgi:hypothetical protein
MVACTGQLPVFVKNSTLFYGTGSDELEANEPERYLSLVRSPLGETVADQA